MTFRPRWPRHSPVRTNKFCSNLNLSLVFSANRGFHLIVIFVRKLSTKILIKENSHICGSIALPYCFHHEQHSLVSMVYVFKNEDDASE